MTSSIINYRIEDFIKNRNGQQLLDTTTLVAQTTINRVDGVKLAHQYPMAGVYIINGRYVGESENVAARLNSHVSSALSPKQKHCNEALMQSIRDSIANNTLLLEVVSYDQNEEFAYLFDLCRRKIKPLNSKFGVFGSKGFRGSFLDSYFRKQRIKFASATDKYSGEYGVDVYEAIDEFIEKWYCKI